MNRKLAVVRAPKNKVAAQPEALLTEVRELILSTRQTVARGVNTALVLLYWKIGERIRRDILSEKRAEYGQEIVVSLIRQLTWTHFIALLPLDKPLQRDFYAEMCRLEQWSVRALRAKIGGMLYERTALSRRPAKLAARELKELREEDKLTPDLVFAIPTCSISSGSRARIRSAIWRRRFCASWKRFSSSWAATLRLSRGRNASWWTTKIFISIYFSITVDCGGS